MSSRLASHSLSLSTQRRVGPSRWLSLAGEARVSARARGILEALPWRQAEARPSNGTSKARYAFGGAGGVQMSRKLHRFPHCWPTLVSDTCLVLGGCVLIFSVLYLINWIVMIGYSYCLLRSFWSFLDSWCCANVLCTRHEGLFFRHPPPPRSKHPHKTPNRAQPAPPQPERHPRQGGWGEQDQPRAAGLFFGKGPK